MFKASSRRSGNIFSPDALASDSGIRTDGKRPYLDGCAGIRLPSAASHHTSPKSHSGTMSDTLHRVLDPWFTAHVGSAAQRVRDALAGKVAMLACNRIGAVHSVVFGGFSAEAVSTDSGARGLAAAQLRIPII